jgi:hypothetical protein
MRLLIRFGGLSRVEAHRIWDARNALVHSFGVRRILRKTRTRPPRSSSVRIQLTDDVQPRPVVRAGTRRWQISVPALYRLMTIVVPALEKDLRLPRNTKQVQQFGNMFRRYGRIRIRMRS